MNRGVLQNSPVQQMMASENPSWWPNINNLMRPPISSSHHQQPFLSPPPYNSNNDNNSVLQAHYTMNNMVVASSSWLDDHPTHHQEQHQLPDSWSQLLGGVLLGEGKKMDTNNWEEQQVEVLQQQQQAPHHYSHIGDVKQESSVNSYNNNNNNVYNTTHDQEFQLASAKIASSTNWSYQNKLNNIPVSSPQSCVTSFSSSNNNLLDFSSSISSDNLHSRNPTPAPDHTSECNSAATGGAAKKAKIQHSSTQSNTTLKVRKEKLGDRITALHQLVSPFGKTDTASVLLEAIGYIRFLQSQIEALSIPYLNNGAGTKRQPNPDSSYEEPKDLRSKGLCLVPVSCTLHVGSDNGADYWAPAFGGGFR